MKNNKMNYVDISNKDTKLIMCNWGERGRGAMMLTYYCEESSKLGKIIGRETQGISNRSRGRKKKVLGKLLRS